MSESTIGRQHANDAREAVTVLPFSLLQWVQFETISDLVAEAKTKSPSCSTKGSAPHAGQHGPAPRIPDIPCTHSSWLTYASTANWRQSSRPM
jgi:hypothetical protein